HELRTPVAELRTVAELALRWPDARGPQTDRDVLAIAVHMEGLVDRLLTLLRSERGLVPVVPQSLSLNDLIAAVARTFASRAEARHLTLEVRPVDGHSIESDPILLRSIVANLLDNAVEYA